MTAALTVSISGVSYAVFNPEKLKGDVQVVADRATCRTVDTAIVGYEAVTGVQPTTIGELREWVRGDISAYSIKNGMAFGPGC
ncbi:hypothetical protein B0I29_11841 [Actinoplanes lutulentus]|uniref:Uncharacterized protein n=2 Tax=Actinoplanes lutulentus TaxID=1287878 RepID=A0A327Z2B5_9ACTN|nr:hypothetical protein B0I29_11841 [Actinoplanes lutulentus]